MICPSCLYIQLLDQELDCRDMGRVCTHLSVLKAALPTGKAVFVMMQLMTHNLLIAIGGATGSGKTALSLQLAKRYPQLVLLSADSRQIYKKLDIGSAKVGGAGIDTALTGHSEPVFIAEGVPQFLIDIAEPGDIFTLADYQKEAERLIRACWDARKIPLLVGGTGLYLQAVIEGYDPQGEPDRALRAELETLPVVTLQEKLATVGGEIATTDRQNKRRVIRAIERQMQAPQRTQKTPITRNTAVFVLERDWGEQASLAPDMVQERLDLGLIAETQHLLANGTDKEWLRSMGLSYRLVIDMLDGHFPEADLKTRMTHAFRQLMRRQRTWFNRMPQTEKLSADKITARIASLLDK